MVKNQGMIDALDLDQLRDLFVLADPDRCVIESYEVLDTNRNEIPYSLLFQRLNLDNRTTTFEPVMFNTTIDVMDGTTEFIEQEIIIKAIAKGGAFAYKTVNLRIVVCGWEEVSLTEDDRVLYEFHLDLNPIVQKYTLAQNFTTNDTDCPVNSFYASLDNDQAPGDHTVPSILDEEIYKIITPGSFPNITEQMLWMQPGEENEFPFFIGG